ncbi:alpha/beta hydrolase [Laspinema olomoucense]|uniref:alpha/beta hydrolase n=1 Tax=Laspinema olomoucense TaxID=3231600 RepID=UPI0021BAA6A3|nr:alpha/beta fold hydrolase [Laspinema sp. D3a]MCT7987033.1 alpha/beta fold hydrolase [Laspinema sp. D3a]
MLNYCGSIADFVCNAKSREDALPLLNEHCRSRFFLHPRRTKKVLLFFHGFTAAPWQFVPMGEAFFKAGYNVLVPLMPGHGQGGNWSRQNPAPLPTTAAVYQNFAQEWLDRAQELGEEVYIGGLSGGGTVAAWLALERCNDIAGCLLFAPYLSSSSRVLDLFVRKLTPEYYDWGAPRPGQIRHGYDGFEVEALKTVLLMGSQVLNRAKREESAPMFIISSESDRAVGHREHRTLFESVSRFAPRSWYHIFDRVLDIPHTMMTQGEGNPHESMLIAMAKAYIDSKLTWNEIGDIAERMTRGETFDEAVRTLNLDDRAAAEMPIFMTLLDKRSLVMQRYTGLRRA